MGDNEQQVADIEEQEFFYYVPTTFDPSPWVMVGTLAICVLIFLAAIVYLVIRRRRTLRKRHKESRTAMDQALVSMATSTPRQHSLRAEDDTGLYLPPTEFIASRRSTAGRLQGWNEIADYFDRDVTDDLRTVSSEVFEEEDVLALDLFDQGGVLDELSEKLGGGRTLKLEHKTVDEEKPEGTPAPISFSSEDVAANYDLMEDPVDRDLSCGTMCRYVVSLFRRDREMNKLLKLAIPYSISAVIESFFGLLTLGVIGRLLGTKALSAYIMVYYGIEITTMFLSGLLTGLSAVCSQAIGSGNYVLAGQYVQIAVSIYLLGFLPQFILWWKYVFIIMLRLEFDVETAAIAQNYARVVFFSSALHGFHSGLDYLMETSGYEKFSTVCSSLYAISTFAGSLFVAVQDQIPFIDRKPSLAIVGMVELVVVVVFLFVKLLYLRCKPNWWRNYWPGLTGSFALFQWQTVKFFFKAAFPLSIGYILSYGEWEILFILASRLGPAEVAAWGLLGEIWSALESLTTSWGDAAEVRGAQLLGAGRADSARLSAHKALALGTLGSLLASLLVYVGAGEVPQWLTDDVVLQAMVENVLPLVAVGNITLTLGTLSFQLIGAQARYSLATAVQFLGSWVVTLPLAILSAVVLRWNLQGLVAAVVLGYMVSGMLNFVILCSTNWEWRSAKIVAKNQKLAGNDDESSSSSEPQDGLRVAENKAVAQEQVEMSRPENSTRDPAGVVVAPRTDGDESTQPEKASPPPSIEVRLEP